jgi:uncharacterized membrane protein
LRRSDLVIELCALWLVIGGMLGALTHAAALIPVRWRGGGWHSAGRLMGIGTLAGLAGGWSGMLTFGRAFGSSTAIWCAILALVFVPMLADQVARRRANRSSAAADA